MVRHGIVVIPIGPPPDDATTGGAVMVAMAVGWSKQDADASSPKSRQTRTSQTPYQRPKRPVSPAVIEKTRLFQTPTVPDVVGIEDTVKLSVSRSGNATLSI